MNSTPLCLTAENLFDMQAELERELVSLYVAEKDILRAQLLVEELSLRMINQGHAEQVNIRIVKQLFGKIQIHMTAEGMPYNPLVEVADWTEDDDNYYAMMILKANRQRLNCIRKNNRNIVTINVRGETNKQLWLLAAGIVGGLLCGVVMKITLSHEVIALIDNDIITPIKTMFLHALDMVIAPVIFFSILSGLIGMGNGAGVGKIGTKLIGLCVFTSAVASIIALIVAQIIFSGEVAKIGTIPPANVDVAGKGYDFSPIKFIVDIIPANLIDPLTDGNMLQVIFVAVLFGSCLNALGDRARILQEIIAVLNEFFMKVVGVIVLFVPLIAFFAMVDLVVDMGVDVMLTMSELIAGHLISSCAMLGVYMLMILFIGKLSPLPFLKKIPSLISTPLATSSSAISMPMTMDICVKKLGVSPKITSFAIPVGTTVNMNGACLYMPLAVIMFMKMYGIDVDFKALLLIFAMTMSVAVGTPAVPNVGVIFLLTAISMFGVPKEIAGLLFCMDAIADRICTCVNVMGNTTATWILARTENLVDEKIYSA